MNAGRFAAATALCVATMLLIGAIWHGALMSGFYDTLTSNPNKPFLPLIAVGYVVLGISMMVVYCLARDPARPAWSEGVRWGVYVGLLWTVPHNIVMIGESGLPVVFVVVDGVWQSIEQGVGGLVLAITYDRLANPSPALSGPTG